MRTLRGRRVVEKIVNLTGKAIYIYEESSGIILTLIPSIEKLPYIPKYGNNKLVDTFYIVEHKDVEMIGKYRTLTDIAVIDNESLGRDGFMISTLVLARDPNIQIGIRRRYYCPKTSTTVTFEETLSPKEKLQQRFEIRHYAEVF